MAEPAPVRHQVVVDVETTGLDHTRHVPVEVAWWDLTTGARGVFIPPHPNFDMHNAEVIALELNGYYDRGLDNPNRWDLDRAELRTLHAVLVGQTLAGSNPGFDARFLAPLFAAERLDPEPWHHRLDDLAGYARGVLGLGHLPGLSEVCELVGVVPGDHTAEADVLATGRAFLELARRRAALTAPPTSAVVLDPASDVDADAMARAVLALPPSRVLRASERQYGRRLLGVLAEGAGS